jgi:hypothetical protein
MSKLTVATKPAKIKSDKDTLVFNFTAIFNCWIEGKCTTEYLQKYVNQQVVTSFIKELERIKK